MKRTSTFGIRELCPTRIGPRRNTPWVSCCRRGRSIAEAESLFRSVAGAGVGDIDDVKLIAAAQYNLGVLLYQPGEIAEAESWFRKVIAADEPYTNAADPNRAQYNLASFCERGELTEAEMRWREAALSRGDTRAQCRLGVLLATRGNPVEAEPWLRKVVAANDADSEAVAVAQYHLGVLLAERGEIVEAEIWFSKAAANADQTEAQINLAVMLMERGETADAESWFRKVAAAGDTRVYFNLGLLLAKRGETEEAEIWWRKGAAAGDTRARYYLRTLPGAKGRRRGRLANWIARRVTGPTDPSRNP